MKYFMLCVCLALASALEQDKSTSQQTNNDLLNSHKPQPLEPLTIRSNIPSHLLIPSISAADSAGLKYGNPINSNLNIQSYSVQPLSDSSFGNDFQTANLNVGSGIITIPTQQFGSAVDYNTILNLDTLLAAAPTPIEIKQIESLNPIINSLPQQQNSNSFSIDEAKLVSKLEFSENKSIKLGTNNPSLISGFNRFDVSKDIKIQNISPTKTSYSIVQVPEVASIHKTGPLVASDIPSVPELIKIFYTKSTHNLPEKATDTVAETTITKFEKSDEEVLDLIEERISPSVKTKQTNSASLSLESRTTDSENNTLGESEEETTENELTTIVTERIDKTEFKDILEDSEIISITSKKVENDLNKVSNKAQDASHLESRVFENTITKQAAEPLRPQNFSSINSTNEKLLIETAIEQLTTSAVTGSINKTEYKDILEDSEIISITSKKEDNYLNKVLPQNNSTINSTNEKLLIETAIEQLTAAAVTGSINKTEYKGILEDSEITSKKVDTDLNKVSNRAQDASHLESRLSENTITKQAGGPITPQNISSTNSANKPLLNETAVEQSLPVSQLTANDFSNANDILKETSEFKAIIASSESLVNSSDNSANAKPALNDDSVPSTEADSNNTHVSESKLENNTSLNVNENLSSQTTGSSLIPSRISSIEIIDNLGNDIDVSQTDLNSTELENIENNDVGKVDEPLKPIVTHSCVQCSYRAYINNLNKTFLKESESESPAKISKPQNLVTSNSLSSISNVESRFSDDIHSSDVKNVTEILNDSNRTESIPVTEKLVDALIGHNETDATSTYESTSSTGDLEEDHLAVYNSSILHILDAVKQANL